MEKTCIISFSARPGGNCASIAGEIQKYWQGRGEDLFRLLSP